MKTAIKKSLQGLLLVPALALGVSAVVPMVQPTEVSAQSLREGVDAAQGADQQNTDVKTIIQTVINILLYIIGAVAVIMIVFGGFRYVTSGGDSSSVSSAKNTILYAVIGLVVAVLAWAIVNFVLTDLFGIE